MMPTPTELATIAATMAPDEASFDNAARKALQLWQACHKVIGREIKNEEYWRTAEEGDAEFLTACGLDRDHINSAHLVPLDVFLKAVAPKSGLTSILSKWQEFWEQEDGNSDRKHPMLKWAYETSILPDDPHDGIRRDSLMDLRMQFLIFLRKKAVSARNAKGAAGPRAKKIYAAVKALLSGSPMTAENGEIFKEITPKDRDMAAGKLQLTPVQIGKLDAAIQSSKTPVRARPRLRR